MKGMKGDNKLFHCEDRDTATASGTQAPAVGNFRRGIQHSMFVSSSTLFHPPVLDPGTLGIAQQ